MKPILLRLAAGLNKAADLPLPLIWGVLGGITLLWSAQGRADFPFGADEAYTVLQVRAHDWSELLRINLGNEETPPLYFVLLRLWAMLWGDSAEGTLRLFSACCFAATVPIVGWLGQRLYGVKVGLWAALLMALSPLGHFSGQDTRAYALALLLMSLVLVFAHKYVSQPSWRSWLAYVLSASALLYTTYLAAFSLLGLSLAGLGHIYVCARTQGSRPGGAMKGWISAQLMILLAFVPWLPGVSYQYHVLTTLGYSPQNPSPLLKIGTDILKRCVLSLVALGAGITGSGLLFWASVALIGLIGLVVALTLLRRCAGELWLAWFGGVTVPLLGVVTMFQGVIYYTYRYALLALPAFVVCVVVTLSIASRWALLKRGLLVSLVVISVFNNIELPPVGESHGGWRRMARVVEQQAQPGDGLFFAPPWIGPAFRVQYTGPDLAHGAETFAEYQGRAVPPWDIDSAALESFIRPGRRAWIVWQRAPGTGLPPLPRDVQIQEQAFGSTSLLLITMKASDEGVR